MFPKLVGSFENLEEAFAIGERISRMCTAHFGDGTIVKLALEKVVTRMLGLAPKRYIMRKMVPTPAGIEPIRDMKGIEGVRRSTPLFIQQLVEELMENLFQMEGAHTVPPRIDGAVKAVHDAILKLARGEYNLSEYEITCAIKKDPRDYKNLPPSMQLIQRVRERDGEKAPPFEYGTRLRYAMFLTPMAMEKGAAASVADFAELIEYAEKHKLLPHNQYYLEMMRKIVLRIMAHVLTPGDIPIERKMRRANRILFENPDIVREWNRCIHERASVATKNSVLSRWLDAGGVPVPVGLAGVELDQYDEYDDGELSDLDDEADEAAYAAALRALGERDEYESDVDGTPLPPRQADASQIQEAYERYRRERDAVDEEERLRKAEFSKQRQLTSYFKAPEPSPTVGTKRKASGAPAKRAGPKILIVKRRKG